MMGKDTPAASEGRSRKTWRRPGAWVPSGSRAEVTRLGEGLGRLRGDGDLHLAAGAPPFRPKETAFDRSYGAMCVVTILVIRASPDPLELVRAEN